MDSNVRRQVETTLEALILSKALGPLTRDMLFGDEAADAFARLLTQHLRAGHER